MTGAAESAQGPGAILHRIAQCRLVVVLRSPTSADALDVARVLLEAGVQVLEVTGTTPDACGVLATLRRESGAHVLLGVGSIRSTEDARRADDVGADFLVSPGSPGWLIEAMLATGRLALPGVFTATEAMQAHDMGVHAVKLFPASLVGPAGLRALRRPLPDVGFVPTGGIASRDVNDWFDAGALAVGVGGGLAPPTLVGAAEARALGTRILALLGQLSTLPAR